LTQEDLKAGTGLTIDVLQAERAADRARLRYATALVRYNQSQINLLAALGLIDETNVEGGLRRHPLGVRHWSPLDRHRGGFIDRPNSARLTPASRE
jgi:hypothetical protein